jgi:hypothetical protein
MLPPPRGRDTMGPVVLTVTDRAQLHSGRSFHPIHPARFPLPAFQTMPKFQFGEIG